MFWRSCCVGELNVLIKMVTSHWKGDSQFEMASGKKEP